MFKEFFKELFGSSNDYHDPRLHPGEIEPGVFQVAGERIDFVNRTHDGKPMSDFEYESLKDILKPHIE